MEDDSSNNDDLFRLMVKNLASQSPCFKSKVAAVIVRHGEVISQGINESPYLFNCKEIGFCYRIVNSILSGTRIDECRAFGVHAEATAIINAAKEGKSTNLATMYVFGNTEICNSCRAMIIKSGIKRVLYESKYGVKDDHDVLYDWQIHPLDQKRKLQDWIKSTNPHEIDSQKLNQHN